MAKKSPFTQESLMIALISAFIIVGIVGIVSDYGGSITVLLTGFAIAVFYSVYQMMRGRKPIL